MLAVVARTMLGGWHLYNFGRLVGKSSSNSVSPVTENIEGNIETFLESAVVSGICFQVEIGSIWGVKPPANSAFAKRLPTSGLNLD